jgi:hypothetical protein
VPQVPAAPHVWTPLFEHCTSPGEHTPVHAPLTHACDVQGTGVPHIPADPHDCTALPEHCTWPALQGPSHTPAAQPPLAQGVP